MLDRGHEPAQNDSANPNVGVVAGSLDAFLDELISSAPGITFSGATARFDVFPDEPGEIAVTDATTRDHLAPTAEATFPTKAETIAKTNASLHQVEPTQEAGPPPARVYSISDLMLFERLTGYRLVAQRQLWRSVDKDGSRAMAADRLFTVLAEEAFQLADRQRRNGPSPQADLTLENIAATLTPMRAIAAHLGERGNQASDRLEAVVAAALSRPMAA